MLVVSHHRSSVLDRNFQVHVSSISNDEPSEIRFEGAPDNRTADSLNDDDVWIKNFAR